MIYRRNCYSRAEASESKRSRLRNKRVFVIGAGGHGKVVIDAILSSRESEVIGFIDDDERKIGKEVLGISVVGAGADLSCLAAKYQVHGIVLAIGDNYIREQLFRRVKETGLAVMGVIHPSASISRFSHLGEGVVVLAGSVINAGTVVADNVCINTRASIDHDNHLGYSCQVFPNATLAGGVHVGECSYIGSGAVVIPNRKIARFAYVGAGAVVIRDVAEGAKVVGVPAREIRARSESSMQCT